MPADLPTPPASTVAHEARASDPTLRDYRARLTVTVDGKGTEEEARQAIADALADPRVMAIIRITPVSWWRDLMRDIAWPIAVAVAYWLGVLVGNA